MSSSVRRADGYAAPLIELSTSSQSFRYCTLHHEISVNRLLSTYICTPGSITTGQRPALGKSSQFTVLICRCTQLKSFDRLHQLARSLSISISCHATLSKRLARTAPTRRHIQNRTEAQNLPTAPHTQTTQLCTQDPPKLASIPHDPAPLHISTSPSTSPTRICRSPNSEAYDQIRSYSAAHPAALGPNGKTMRVKRRLHDAARFCRSWVDGWVDPGPSFCGWENCATEI